MRRQDIKLGTVYAYQDRKHQPLRPVVFLAANPYVNTIKGESTSRFMPAGRYDRVGQFHGPTCGYPAVAAWNVSLRPGLDWAPVISRMTPFTLSDFTAAMDSKIDDAISFGLVDRLACVLGPWDEVIAAIAAKRARVDRMAAEADERERASRIRAGAVIASLAAAGVAVKPPYLTGEVTVIGIALGEAEKLAVLLGASTEGSGE